MYGSFLSAAEKALSLEDIGRFVLLLRDYALKGEDAHSDNPVIEAFLEMAKPNLKAAKKRYEDACKGREHGWKGAKDGIKGGRPRQGETKEEAYERRAKERELKEQELNQEPLPAAEPKTAVEVPENPKNPLNDNVNVNEKENDYVKDDDYVYVYEKGDVSGYEDVKDNPNEKEKDYVDEKDDDNGKGGFVDSLILKDFDDEDYSSFGIGSMSSYIEGKLLEEQERLYRQSQGLEEDRELYI